MTDKTPTSFDALVQAVAQATGAVYDAERDESIARSRATGARNDLNAAQKALDHAMIEMRKGAPGSSWWGR